MPSPYVIGNIGLPGRFAATVVCATEKRPDSRGTPAFFAALLSAVTQFDVCPVGWHSCRMEFLRRTGASRALLTTEHVRFQTPPSVLLLRSSEHPVPENSQQNRNNEHRGHN